MNTPVVEPPATPSALEGRRLTLIAHLEELRRRLWVSLGAIIVGGAVSLAWAGQLLHWLQRPAGPWLPQLAFFSPPEAMLAYLQVAITAGVVLAMPVLLYQVWAFISPGLTPRERGYGAAFVWWGSLLFVAGAAFAYGGLLPVTLRFLLTFGGGTLVPVISVSRYLSFVLMILLACGVIFQLPLIIWMLAKLRVVTAAGLRRKWRHAVVAMTIAAALVTPTTDIATMLLLVVPMLALYEVSIWMAALAGRTSRSDE